MIRPLPARSAWRRAFVLGAALATLPFGAAGALHARPDAAPPTAFFHATLRGSEPAAGSTVARSPARIRLVFSEEIEAALGSIRLVAPDGSVTKLAAGGDPRDVAALVAPVPSALAAGRYRVRWRIVSDDGHPIEGEFAFTVAASADTAVASAGARPRADSTPSARSATGAAPAAEPTTPAPALETALVLPAVLRGLGLGALAALAGLLGFLVTRRDPGAEPRGARLTRHLAAATAVLLVLHFAAWARAVAPDQSLAGGALGALLASGVGRVELARTVFALLAAWALLLARRERLALGLAVAALLVSAGAGHSAAIHPAWTVPAHGLHLLAVAAWLGGLIWLLVLERRTPAAVAAEAARVSSAALAAVVVVALSGLVQTWLFLPAWSDLLTSTYGRIALAKVAGLGVLVLFGAHHRYRVLPRLAERTVADALARSLRREVAVMSLVILLGGLLAYVAPPAH